MPITYTNDEHQVWHALIKQQLPIVKKIACREYLEGLNILDLQIDTIPKLKEVSAKLTNLTGWSLIPVNTIIPHQKFFCMLADKKFPVVTTIRPKDELDFYTNESLDIFHEFFGHCPLITNKKYSDSLHKFGKLAVNSDKETIKFLSKIFWVTFEFGILQNNISTKIYGAGILPARTEIKRITNCNEIIKVKLDVFSSIDASLQGNVMQPKYYTLESLDELYYIIDYDIPRLLSLSK